MTPDDFEVPHTVTIYHLPDIPWERVESVYRGRSGCMCGCRGDYAYTATSAPHAAEHRGYAIPEQDVPRVRAAHGRLDTMQKAAREFGIEVQDGYIYSVDVPSEDANGRTRMISYVLYLKNDTEEDRAANAEILKNAIAWEDAEVTPGILGPG